ncbi:MAG: WYL domain-containing protein [Gemmatimonadaceae bacterium]|nr:WYL domain-containing protein [Gemmatimonadaceae bacterium]
MTSAPRTLPDPDDDAMPVVPGGARNPKLARWIDLLAALLGRNAPATFLELTASVPEYQLKAQARDAEPDPVARARLSESLKRMFERDKDDLRAYGVAIESSTDDDGNAGGAYRLRRTDFYLPYLCVAVPGGAPLVPAKVDQYGYKALASLVLEPDELAAIVDAAASVRGLGDPNLRAEVDAAMRKLAVDLPVDTAAASPDLPRVVAARTQPDAEVFAVIGQAMRHRKVMTFEYHAMSSGVSERRTVEPYGLFFLSAHWYLAARDQVRGELRNFRLNRISAPKLKSTALQTPDFAVPSSFHLREHARSRHVWELGDGDAVQVLVDFHGESGPTLAAAQLGEPVEGFPSQRRFSVRRTDSFARWILTFCDEAVVLAPPAMAREVHGLAAATLALYASDAPAELPTPNGSAAATRTTRVPWEPRTAAAQLRRLLLAVPQIADGEEHSLQDVARRIGTDVGTLTSDLHSLVWRFDLPAGFVEGVQIFLEPDRVSAVSNHLRRPMRLTVPELCALDLGLAVVRAQRPPDEHAVLERARARLQAVIARLPGDPIPDSLYNVSVGEYGSITHLPVVRHGLRTHAKIRIGYRKSGGTATDQRVVCPYALVAGNGMLYLIAYCDRSVGIRVFRMDRVLLAEATPDTFKPPADFSVDDVMRDGRVFSGDQPEVMLVRYSSRIARWIAEREGRVVSADGSLVLEHPLADWEWGVRHTLQYGADAEVLQPASLRVRLREQLERVVAAG